MEELVLQGQKCCTTRDEVKGIVGDIFRVKDRVYRIVYIRSFTCDNIARLYMLEGFNCSVQFVDTLEKIYPEIFDCCDNIVYAHFFAYVGECKNDN